MANAFQLISSLVQLRVKRVSDPEAQRQLAWVLDVVTALSLLQNRLADRPDGAFSAYLGEAASFWSRMVEDRIELAVEAEPIAIAPEAAASLALIAHELVANAVEHAFPNGRRGNVKVALRGSGDGWAELSVSDDGEGLPAKGPPPGSFGLELVRRLAGQLGGEVEIAGGAGTTARVRFPRSVGDSPVQDDKGQAGSS